MLALEERLSNYKTQGLTTKAIASGKLVRVVGLTLEATGCKAPIGSLCKVETLSGEMEAEVVGFSGESLYLMPSEQITGVLPGAKVTPITTDSGLSVGMELLYQSLMVWAIHWMALVISIQRKKPHSMVSP